MHNFKIGIVLLILLVIAIPLVVYFVQKSKEHYEVPYWNRAGCCKCDKGYCPIEARKYQYCRCTPDYVKFL